MGLRWGWVARRGMRGIIGEWFGRRHFRDRVVVSCRASAFSNVDVQHCVILDNLALRREGRIARPVEMHENAVYESSRIVRSVCYGIESANPGWKALPQREISKCCS